MTKKKKKKAAKKRVKPRESKSGTGGSTEPKKDDKVLPRARAKPSQIDALVTLVRRLVRQTTEAQRRQAQDRERQESVTCSPAPWDAAFAAVVTELAETRRQLDRIESRQQQPPRDPSLDVPASVLSLRRMFAGACKTLGITQPTPAIIGRVMHDKEIFTRDDEKSPRSLLESIYSKPTIPDHLSPKIRGLLERYGNQPSRANDLTDSAATSPTQQQRSQNKPKAASSKIAGELGSEFDCRFILIENTGHGKKDPVQSGGKKNYRRYLTPEGQSLFKGWPEWTDATGGIGLVDEDRAAAPSPPNEPANAAPSPNAGADTTPPPA